MADTSYGPTLATVDTATDRIVGTPARLGGRFLFDSAGRLVQLVGAAYRVLDGTTFAPVSPMREAPGTVTAAAAPTGRLVLLTVAGTRPADDVTVATTSAPSVTVVDPAQWINASTLPRRIVVGGPSTVLPFTVSQRTPAAATTVGLMTAATGRRSAALAVDPDANGRLTGPITVAGPSISRWGPQAWTLSAGSAATVDVQRTDMRARSLLGVAASRSGDLVTVNGSAKYYVPVPDGYDAWAGRPVALQRYSSSGWVTIATLVTDRLGHVHTTVRIPWRVGLRLADADTPNTWGATTAQLVV